MRMATYVAVSGTAALIAATSADAAYLGLGLTSQNQTISGVPRTVYRVYAVFDNPNDYLLSVSGDADYPITIKSLNATATGPGSSFFNPASGGNTAPVTDGGAYSAPGAPWDTFATIGVTSNEKSDPDDDLTQISDGFPNFIVLNSLVSFNMSWFIDSPIEQGRAGGPNGVNGNFFNAYDVIGGWGVLMSQLTINAGGNVFAKVKLSGIADGTSFATIAGVGTFPMIGDANGDYAVNVDDILAVINAWGPCEGQCSQCGADVTHNCIVDVDDLLTVINFWE